MTEPTNPTNPTPQPTPQLTPEEIEILKSMVQGHKAITWLSGRMKGLALWVAAIVGGLVALNLRGNEITDAGCGALCRALAGGRA